VPPLRMALEILGNGGTDLTYSHTIRSAERKRQCIIYTRNIGEKHPNLDKIDSAGTDTDLVLVVFMHQFNKVITSYKRS